MELGTTVYVVDDDNLVRRSCVFSLRAYGFNPIAFSSGSEFLAVAGTMEPGCVLLDLRMPGLDGLETITRLNALNTAHQVILMTAHGDVASAVTAMKLGAIDFLEKPFSEKLLLEMLAGCRATLQRRKLEERDRKDCFDLLQKLSTRERQVLELTAEGLVNKEIARLLDLSVRTVEMYRANVKSKAGVKNLQTAIQLVSRVRQYRPAAFEDLMRSAS